ncbi:MAG: GWxTD domain-containing protein [bacterium]|nr:GWxTD domain-containing protein [candidate division KSB1 bacterium]MDH7559593.1 GWxTD domain-containing protein [bacterium]
MRRVFSLLVATVLLVAIVAPPTLLWAQTEMSQEANELGPRFHFDVSTMASPQDSTKSRVHVYVKITFDEIQFVRSDSGYSGSYEVTVVVLDKARDQVAGEVWRDEMATQAYEQTTSRRDFNTSYASFDIPPGEYTMTIGVTDLETRERRQVTQPLKVRDFRALPLALSDITFASVVESDSLGLKSIRPDVSDNTIGISRTLYACFEIYTRRPRQTVTLSYRVVNARNKVVLARSYKRSLAAWRTLDYFPLCPDSLGYGRYTLRLEVKGDGVDDQVEKMFNVRWSGLPATVSDLDLAIEQVRYVAEKKEYDALRKAPEEKKLSEFMRFWKRRDPTPGTEENEAMDEHYRRVEYANERFTVFREGWKTDMGMVYIILGPPNDIERHPYPAGDKPYEIWYYYRINRQFVFYDPTGFGEYRLLNPYSLYDLNRLRE